MIKKNSFFIIIFCFIFSYACTSQEEKLFEAAKNGNVNLIKSLIQDGVDVNCRDKTGQNPLHHACYLGHLEVARVLIESGAKINQRVSDLQLTPLHGATMNGDPKLVAFLIEHSADINAKDSEGGTPLVAACWIGALETVTYLVSKGAKIDIATSSGVTPLHCATQSNNLELVQFLINKGSKISSQTMEGVTPLHIAAALGNLSITRLLLINGADKQIRLKSDSNQRFCLKAPILSNDDVMEINLSKGQSALDIANKRGHKEIISLLKNAEQPLQQ